MLEMLNIMYRYYSFFLSEVFLYVTVMVEESVM